MRLYVSNKIFFLNNKNKYLIISTTKPETILGDSAIAINPNDNRYNKFIGKKIIVPLINRIIPIISDNNVYINKETGCMKVSPAHDFIDYEIALKNNLDIINVINKEGKTNNILEIYKNLNFNIKYYENIPYYFKNISINILKYRILFLLKKKIF
ncbi:class I tRNA ligase family protein [endosymbiont of Metamasius hemipterus]|uniref:valine--tRNA ligase n=1 Tax=endosymbiont of Metamasius hemipterus TaxID=204627 RepID=A0ABT0TWA2_9GAMM|nr:class I tRNA ligase family protein [endosymbiont of Metamasius hemipterus]